ncbi:MAG TPA: hypothetical protein H9957_05540 [Candidatus Dorea stercoravium]|nr:hypothetical protein [Candidatus Dorea stercoravium]
MKDKETRKKSKKNRWKRRVLAVCLVLVLIPTGYIGIIFGCMGKVEPKTDAVTTNAESSQYTLEEFSERLQPYSGLYEEAVMAHADEPDSGTYVIPGLESARTLLDNGAKRFSVCTGMTPQGIAVSGQYLFISAYCQSKNHNSVIFVVDKETHDFVKEVVLPNKAHVGSLAYDARNDNLWVCGSRNGIAQVNALDMERIEAYDFSEGWEPISFLHVNNILDIPRSSFMAYQAPYLYVGYYSTQEDSTIKKYEVQDDGNIRSVAVEHPASKVRQGVAEEDDLKISPYAQGMTFLGDILFLSYSMGIFPSRLAAYQVSDGIRDFTDEMALEDIRLPYMLEQIYMDGGTMYLLFESGAYPYRYLPGLSVDRVLKIDIL